MNILFKTFVIATSLLCAGLWLWGCSKPVGGVIPLSFFVVFVDSTGSNINEKMAASLDVVYVENGAQRSTGTNRFRLVPTDGMYSPVIEMPMTLTSNGTALTVEYILSTHGVYLGTLIAHIQGSRYESVRFNDSVVVPQHNGTQRCYILALR